MSPGGHLTSSNSMNVGLESSRGTPILVETEKYFSVFLRRTILKRPSSLTLAFGLSVCPNLRDETTHRNLLETR